MKHTTALAICLLAIYPDISLAQGSSPGIAAGAKFSTLGIGAEGAVAVTDRSNVRVGFNFLNYSRSTSKRGINYSGDLDLRSFQITYDQYLFSGFHVSPSLLAYNGNHIDASATVPA